MQDIILSPSDFVAVLNQTLEIAFPVVTIEGELANFRVSKNRWVYFDLVDETASVKFFGNVYQLPGPLEGRVEYRHSRYKDVNSGTYGDATTNQVVAGVGVRF